MITVDQIRTYQYDELFWTDASELIEVTATSAWQALEPLLTHGITEIPTVGGDPIQIRRVSNDAPLLGVGNELVAKAAMLRGIIKVPMCLRITQVEPEQYLQIAVIVFRQHFADIDFRIEPADGECKLSYRQGFRSRQSLLGWMGHHITLRPREIPETARIFNLWVTTTQAA